MFLMRFDMRAPSTGAPPTELYAAALEMAAWAESRRCLGTVVCEHHTSSDGYLPSPLILASAMAARTTTLPITVGVVILPLCDPIRLAEEMNVLDIISSGRVSYIAAIGYRPVEYEMYGIDFHRRGAIAEEKLALLLRAKAGDPFEHQGRRIHVTPAPVTPGGPTVMWGGSSAPAARRAGRFGLGFLAHGGPAELEDVYREAALSAGHEPGLCYIPGRDDTTAMFVAGDVDEAWDELGPYMMHDARMYAEWNRDRDDSAGVSFAGDVQELRSEDRTYRILSIDQAAGEIRSGRPLRLHPLIGGLPPGIAWHYLEAAMTAVEQAS